MNTARTALPLLVLSLIASGCSLLNHFGYYKYQKPERVPADRAPGITFPSAYEEVSASMGP